MPLEVAEEVGGFSSLTPSGTSVLLEGQLTQTPEGTKQARLRTQCLQKLLETTGSLAWQLLSDST